MKQAFEIIAKAEALSELWQVLVDYFGRNGYGATSYFTHDQSATAEAPIAMFIHGFRPDLVEAYINADFGRLDIVPRLTMARGRPVRWREAWASTDLVPAEREFLALMRGLEIGDGIGFPCYGVNGRNAYVGVGSMQPDAKVDEVAVREMHLVAQAAHLRISALTEHEKPHMKSLSVREREILFWVARGKSNSVIADILSISAGTVDTYLRRIYEKLGVSDRTSAAVRGIGMGLIAA